MAVVQQWTDIIRDLPSTVPGETNTPADRVYEIRNADDGSSSVLFGVGIEGSRLPSGDHNIRAIYRKGLGLGGNVAAGKLTTLLSRPLGVSGATNPEAANGGEDAEREEKARENAPLTVLTLERAVSIRDYQYFARAFAGIAKAHALWIPSWTRARRVHHCGGREWRSHPGYQRHLSLLAGFPASLWRPIDAGAHRQLPRRPFQAAPDCQDHRRRRCPACAQRGRASAAFGIRFRCTAIGRSGFSRPVLRH